MFKPYPANCWKKATADTYGLNWDSKEYRNQYETYGTVFFFLKNKNYQSMRPSQWEHETITPKTN